MGEVEKKEQDLSTSNENTNLILEHITDGVYIVDQRRKIQFWNDAAEEISGFSKDEMQESYCQDNLLNHISEDGAKLCTEGCPLHETLVDGQVREATVYLHHKKGHRVKVDVKILPILKNNEILGAIEIFSESKDTARYLEIINNLQNQESLDYIKYLALHDQLTALPNRRYIEITLNKRITDAEEKESKFGILFIDIDFFRNFNNFYGHEIGDNILRALSTTFLNAIRETDMVGRWGGEEFIAIINVEDESQLYEIAERLRRLSENTVLRGTVDLKTTVSVGGVLFEKGDTIDKIINRADSLMYQSKLRGRNRVTIENFLIDEAVEFIDLL